MNRGSNLSRKSNARGKRQPLRIESELPGGIEGSVIRVRGREGINALPAYELEIRLAHKKNPSPDPERLSKLGKSMLGEPVCFGIDVGEMEGPRWRGGIVAEATFHQVWHANRAGEDVLRLRVVSRLSLLGYRRNYRTFLQKTMVEVTQALLSENSAPQAVVRLEPAATTGRPAHRLQIGETDLNFLRRWWEDAGTNFLAGAGEEDQVTLFNSSSQLSRRRHEVPWISSEHPDTVPGIQAMTTTHRLTRGSTRAGDFDWTKPAATIDATARSKGGRAVGEARYFGYGFPRSREEATRCARRLQDTQDAEQSVTRGRGCLPSAAAGDRLGLGRSAPLLITGLSFEATLEPAPMVQTWFEAVPEDTVLAPPRSADPLLLPGCYPAVVVDQKDPESLGRVRVRFAWDSTHDPGVWCPVEHTNDHVFRPRVGQVVHVHFQLADPDRPWVGPSVYHPGDMPTHPREETEHAGIRGPHSEILFIEADDHSRFQRHVSGDDVLFVDGDRFAHIQGDLARRVAGQSHLRIDGEAVTQVRGTSFLAAKKIALVTPGGFIVLDSGGVTVNGPIVHLNKPGASAPSLPGYPKTLPKPSTNRNRRQNP